VHLPDWPVVLLLLLVVAAVTVAVVRRSAGDRREVVGGDGAAGGANGGAAGGRARRAAGAPDGPGGRAAGDAGRFRLSGRFSSGYRRDEVDAFFARVDSGRVTADEIEGVVFGSTFGRDGYDEREVDEALDRAVGRLRRAP
jgi:DivIVA domain-containing protein